MSEGCGFFFFPVAAVHELISIGKCSEMDIVLDLWVHAIYNDEQVQGSELGPVVYFRNCTGSPLTNFSDLALRWGISKATVSRILNKLQEKEYLSLVSFTGRHGSVIYLCSYLSTMFNISDVMIDKEEISMTFQIPVHVPEASSLPEAEPIREEQITIMEAENSVSGQTACPDGKMPYRFELTLSLPARQKTAVAPHNPARLIQKLIPKTKKEGKPSCQIQKQTRTFPQNNWIVLIMTSGNGLGNK